MWPPCSKSPVALDAVSESGNITNRPGGGTFFFHHHQHGGCCHAGTVFRTPEPPLIESGVLGVGEPSEQYVTWLTEQEYAPRNVYRRVPLLMPFGEFARRRGATTWEELPDHLEPFVEAWLRDQGEFPTTGEAGKAAGRGIHGPIHQLLRIVVPGYSGGGHARDQPFRRCAPDFFVYLRRERGLRDPSVVQYDHHLRRFEEYLELTFCASWLFMSSKVSRCEGPRSVCDTQPVPRELPAGTSWRASFQVTLCAPGICGRETMPKAPPSRRVLRWGSMRKSVKGATTARSPIRSHL